MKADLHLHTTASDGLLAPGEMVRQAAGAGIDIMAVTDHDSIAGLKEALEESRKAGMKIIPGIELSVGGEEEIHLLAYGVSPEDSRLCAYLNGLLKERQERGAEMLERLRAIGIHLDMEDASNPQGDFVGRAAIARSLVKKGICKNTQEAFRKYLDRGKPGYVPRKKIGMENGSAFLRSIGAAPVLAHPGRMTLRWRELTSLLPLWQEAGLLGLEAWHSSHAAGNAMMYERWGRAHGFLITGGSDCHGKMHEVALLQGLGGWNSAEEDVQALLQTIEA